MSAIQIAMRVLLIGLWCAVMCVAGCQGGGANSGPAIDVVEVHLSDGTKLSGPFGPGLRIVARPEVSYIFTLSAQTGGREWSVGGPMLADDVRAAHAVMGVTSADPEPGQVKVWDSATGFASSGSVEIVMEKGSVRGMADAIPDGLSATFSGVLGVSCWVPASRLPGGNPSGTTGGGQEAFVEDRDFQTSECSPFRSIGK